MVSRALIRMSVTMNHAMITAAAQTRTDHLFAPVKMALAVMVLLVPTMMNAKLRRATKMPSVTICQAHTSVHANQVTRVMAYIVRILMSAGQTRAMARPRAVTKRARLNVPVTTASVAMDSLVQTSMNATQ